MQFIGVAMSTNLVCFGFYIFQIIYSRWKPKTEIFHNLNFWFDNIRNKSQTYYLTCKDSIILHCLQSEKERQRDRQTGRQVERKRQTDRDREIDKEIFPCLSILQMWDIAKYDSKILDGSISTGDAILEQHIPSEWFKSWEWASQ